jgi:DNA modification methylase
MKRLIEASSNPGDTVLDPCMGSASVGLACLMSDRNFIGYDISLDYVTKASIRLTDFNTEDNAWLKKLNKRAISA